MEYLLLYNFVLRICRYSQEDEVVRTYSKLKAQSSKLKNKSLSFNVKFFAKETFLFSLAALIALLSIVTGFILLEEDGKIELSTPSMANVKLTMAFSSTTTSYFPEPKLMDEPDKPALIECSNCTQYLAVQKDKSPETAEGKALIWEKAMIWQNNDPITKTVDAYTLKFHIEHTTASGEPISYQDEWFEEINSGSDIYEKSTRYRKAKDQWDAMEADIKERNEKVIDDYNIRLERHRKSKEALEIAEKLNKELQEHHEKTLQLVSE